jgi:uncharacterized tellurite resistance protein B-like protein
MINADGHVDDKEIRMGELMKKHENIDDWEFDYYLKKIADIDKDMIIETCISSLKKCDHKLKVKSIAWMSLIANSDGFMDPQEWKLIYNIYNTELKLKLSEIMEMQKQLPRPD